MDKTDYGLVSSARNRIWFRVWFRSRTGKHMKWLVCIHLIVCHVKNTTYGDRAISVLGLFVYQFGFWLSSKDRSQVPWCASRSVRYDTVLIVMKANSYRWFIFPTGDCSFRPQNPSWFRHIQVVCFPCCRLFASITGRCYFLLRHECRRYQPLVLRCYCMYALSSSLLLS